MTIYNCDRNDQAMCSNCFSTFFKTELIEVDDGWHCPTCSSFAEWCDRNHIGEYDTLAEARMDNNDAYLAYLGR